MLSLQLGEFSMLRGMITKLIVGKLTLPVPVLEHRNFPESSKPVKNCKLGFCRGWLTFHPVQILDPRGRANAALFYSAPQEPRE
jgi:hypothetical protein